MTVNGAVAVVPTVAVAHSLGVGTVTHSGTVIFNFTNSAPIFPITLTGPYEDNDEGWYLDVRIMLPHKTNKYDLDVTKDGTAVVLTWFWPEAYQTMHQFDYEQDITDIACNKHGQLINAQNPSFQTLRHYPLGTTVIPTKPCLERYLARDGSFYIKARLVVHEPPEDPDEPIVFYSLKPPTDASGKLLRKKRKNG
jgi:hypothetical protein